MRNITEYISNITRNNPVFSRRTKYILSPETI